MSEIVDAAVKALNARLGGDGLDGSVKFVIEDEGAVRIDAAGATRRRRRRRLHDDRRAPRPSRSMLDGDLDPTGAFMSGRLTVEGDMGLAMRLGSLLA